MISYPGLKKRFKIWISLMLSALFVFSSVLTACAEDKYSGKELEKELKYYEILRETPYEETGAEKKIYSYVQVPKEYCENADWTGDWIDIEAGGQRFFNFGCGICCLSNMFSTFNEGIAAPDTMFRWLKDNANYNPDSGHGALSWAQLQKMCGLFGFESYVKNKPSDYLQFKEDVKNSDTTLVLVCKYNDDRLWFYTRGHYVNLWQYDEKTDTVFVTDSSGMFNRRRVELTDVYKALKTASSAQYMTVNKEPQSSAEQN